MRITPLDIQHKVFPRKLRGYEMEEVNGFLEAVAETVESLNRENNTLRDKLSSREEEISELRKAEATLTNTLISTQNFADQMKVGAQQEADRIIKEAELRAEQLMFNAQGELTDLNRILADLRRHRLVALEQIRSTVKAFERLVEVEEAENESYAENLRTPVSQEEHSFTSQG